MQTSRAWIELTNQYNIATSTTEPYNPNQNPAEHRIQTMKARTQPILDDTGDPLWFGCMLFTTLLIF